MRVCGTGSGVSADDAAEQIVKQALLVKTPPRVIRAGGWAWLFTLYGVPLGFGAGYIISSTSDFPTCADLIRMAVGRTQPIPVR
jgi:hypothetical protein